MSNEKTKKSEEKSVHEKSRWEFDKYGFIYLGFGTIIYLILDIIFSIFQVGNIFLYITFRIFPAIAIPMIFGLLYGPIVGFFCGFLGKLIADLILYQSIWIWWPIGFGLIGLLSGITYNTYKIGKYENGIELIKGTLLSVFLGVICGIGFSSIISIFFDQLGIYFSLYYVMILIFIAFFNGIAFTPISVRIIEYFQIKNIKNSGQEVPYDEYKKNIKQNFNNYGIILIIFFIFLGFLGIGILNLGFNREFHWGCAGVPLFGPYLAINLRIPLEIISIVSFILAGCISVVLIINYYRNNNQNNKKSNEIN
ncbi:MAG: ECF transporter S component [Candidatus Helarchaeota archaeon]